MKEKNKGPTCITHLGLVMFISFSITSGKQAKRSVNLMTLMAIMYKNNIYWHTKSIIKLSQLCQDLSRPLAPPRPNHVLVALPGGRRQRCGSMVLFCADLHFSNQITALGLRLAGNRCENVKTVPKDKKRKEKLKLPDTLMRFIELLSSLCEAFLDLSLGA